MARPVGLAISQSSLRAHRALKCTHMCGAQIKSRWSRHGAATVLLSDPICVLPPNGTCVTFGVSEAPTTTFESGAFFRQGGVKLYGLILFHELRQVEPAGEGLAILLREVALGRLRPLIEIEAPWTD